MQSRCGVVRWTAALTPALFGPSNPCPDCEAIVRPESKPDIAAVDTALDRADMDDWSESERRLMDGNR